MQSSTLPQPVLDWCNICEIELLELCEFQKLGQPIRKTSPNQHYQRWAEFIDAFNATYGEDNVSMFRSFCTGQTEKFILCILLDQAPQPLSIKQIQEQFENRGIATKQLRLSSVISSMVEQKLIDVTQGFHFFRLKYQLVGSVEEVFQKLTSPNIEYWA